MHIYGSVPKVLCLLLWLPKILCGLCATKFRRTLCGISCFLACALLAPDLGTTNHRSQLVCANREWNGRPALDAWHLRRVTEITSPWWGLPTPARKYPQMSCAASCADPLFTLGGPLGRPCLGRPCAAWFLPDLVRTLFAGPCAGGVARHKTGTRDRLLAHCHIYTQLYR